MDWQVYLAKARNSLRKAQSASEQGDFDSCASRAYFAVFYAEIAALLKLTEFRQERWGHDQVQGEHYVILTGLIFSVAGDGKGPKIVPF